MGKVTTELTMSLDGFIAGPNDGSEHPLGEGGMPLFNWYSSGDTEYVVPNGEMTFKISEASAELLRDEYPKVGALVSGRRTFDIANGWGGNHPVNAPVFIVTHSVPEGWTDTEARFTFVTDGVESAVAQAQQVAGEKNVAVGAASIVQQCIKAGLLDEIQVDLVPLLLGDGVSMFDHLGQSVELEQIGVIQGNGVTHLRYRVVN